MTESRNSLAPPLPMSALGWRDRFVAAAYAFVGFTVLGLFAALVPVFVGQIVDINNQATVGLVVFTVFVASSFGHRLLERALGTRTLVASSIGLGWGSSRSGLALSSLPFLAAEAIVSGARPGIELPPRAAINDVSGERRVRLGYIAIALRCR